MELTAPIMALEALTRPVTVHLYTDSTYVRNGITKWVLGWERNGWQTAAKQPVKNVDLWKRLQVACARHQVEWFWVKGHSGVADNELADELATRGLQEAIEAFLLPDHLAGLFVGPQATPAGLTQPAVRCPLAVADLADQGRLHERHAFGVLGGKPCIEGGFVGVQRCQRLLQTSPGRAR